MVDFILIEITPYDILIEITPNGRLLVYHNTLW